MTGPPPPARPGNAARLLARLRVAEERYDLPDAPMSGGDGLRLLPHPRPELHPARIPLPHRLRRRPPRPPPRGPRHARLHPQLAPLRRPRARPLRLLVPPHPPRRLGRDPRPRRRPRPRPPPPRHLRRRRPLPERRRGRPPRPLHPQQGSRAPRSPSPCPPAQPASASSSTTSPSATPASASSSTGSTARPPARAPPSTPRPTPSPRSKPPSTPCTSSSPPTPTAKSPSSSPSPAPPAPPSRSKARASTPATSPSPASVTAGRLSLGPAETLPPDFRRYTVTLEADGFAASRTLGLEIARDQGPPPPDRIAEALATAAAQGEPDPITALARLATGQPGPETEAMIAAFLAPIADCWDCADFYLVPLLWIRARYAAALSPALLARDRPHHPRLPLLARRARQRRPVVLLREPRPALPHLPPTSPATSSPTPASPAPAAPAPRSPPPAATRVRAWLDHFERWEMAEFNSAPYFPIDLKGLTALYALAPDPDIRARAARGIARLLEIVANSAHQGILTAAQGRSYEHSLRAAASLELSAIARLLWGRGGYRRPPPRPAPARPLPPRPRPRPPRPHRPRPLAGRRRAGMVLPPGRERLRRPLPTTRPAPSPSAPPPRYRWGEWGYQETLVHARIGTEPAGADLDQPPRRAHPVRLRPPLLLGRQRLDPPRPAVPRPRRSSPSTAPRRSPTSPTPGSPAPPSTRATSHGHAAFARSGDGLAALLADGPLERSHRPAPAPTASSAAPAATAAGSSASAPDRASSPAFRARFAALALTEHPDGRIIVDDPDYGVVEFNPDGTRHGRRPHPRPRRAGPSKARGRNCEDFQGRNTMKLRLPPSAAARCSPPPAIAGDVRVMWYSDGVEGAVIEDLLEALHGREPRHQRHPRQRRLPGDPGAAADPAPGRPGPRHRPRHQPQGAGRPLARPHPLPRRPRRPGAPTSPTPSTGCAPTARRPSPAS